MKTKNKNVNDTFAVLIVIPGRKPGTSTKVMMGMLKASQKRTNRAPFTEELMSRQPGIHAYTRP